MPNKTSAKKDLRQATKRATRNRKTKDGVKSIIKAALEALTTDDLDKAKALLQATQQRVDKAVKKGVFKKNKGSRIKSAIAKKVVAKSKA